MTFSSSRFNHCNSVYNLLLFHKIDRDIYDLLIAHGVTPAVACNVVALLVWLDNNGVNVIPCLSNNFNKAFVLCLTAEAESILDCLRGNFMSESTLEIPIIASLTTRSLDLRFFNSHRHEAAERIAETLAVGRFFFDDTLFAVFRLYEAAMEDARRVNAAAPPMPPELARPFMPVSLMAATSVDERSLILIFLKASPLTEQEIIAYFKIQWGNCIERVEEIISSCAKVVFKREGYVALLFHGSVEFRFAINGKPALARRIEERRN